MAWMIIKEKGQPDRVFPLARPTYTVGRGERADLVLANVSVSRSHFRLTRRAGGAGYLVEDLGSQNGTLVNGESVEFHDLETGDTIEAGKYQLVFIGDESRPAVYNNELVEDMPGYTFVKKAAEPTYQMTPAMMVHLRQQREAAERGGVVADDGGGRWLVGEGLVRFGPKGRIPIEGGLGVALARGVVAEVFWHDTQHVLRRRSRLVKVEVNGESVSEHALHRGDRIRVGDSTFEYRIL